MLPDLPNTIYGVLMGSKLISVNEVSTPENGWVTLHITPTEKVKVRETAITGFKYRDHSTLPKVPANMNWGLGE